MARDAKSLQNELRLWLVDLADHRETCGLCTDELLCPIGRKMRETVVDLALDLAMAKRPELQAEMDRLADNLEQGGMIEELEEEFIAVGTAAAEALFASVRH